MVDQFVRNRPGPQHPRPPVAGPPAVARRIDPRFRQRRIDIAREAGRKRLHLLIAATSVLVVLAAGLGLARSPLLEVRHVRITPSPHVPVDDVLAAAGLRGRHQLIDVNPVATERSIERLAWVATARVEREWPATVRISVTERVPVAALAPPGSPSIDVDATGRVLGPGSGGARVPTLVLGSPDGGGPGSGGSPVPAQQIDASFDPGLAVARALPAALVPAVQAIVVGPGDAVGLRLDGGGQVIMGSSADLAAKLVAVLTLVSRQKVGSGVLDVAVPSAPVLTSGSTVGNFSTRTGG